MSEDGPDFVTVGNLVDQLNEAFPDYHWSTTNLLVVDDEQNAVALKVVACPATTS